MAEFGVGRVAVVTGPTKGIGDQTEATRRGSARQARVLPAYLGGRFALGFAVGWWVTSAGAQTPPTFYRDVLPVLEERCQACHRRGEIAPMPLTSYAEARPWARAIREQVMKRAMPPWFGESTVLRFSSDPRLTEAQIRTLAAWAEAGAPAGDPRDAPAPRHWAEGWNIDPPDVVFQMTKGVDLPATGDVDYTYVIVPTGFREDRWISQAEIRPSDRRVVHHAVVYIREPGSDWLRSAPVGVPFTARTLKDAKGQADAKWTDSDLLLVYAPGSLPDRWPEGMAKLVKAGSDLVFQMHYTTRGVAVHDRTSIGLVFAKHAPVKRVLSLQLTNDHFLIPPGVASYTAHVFGTMPGDALLLNLFPHLHFRGKTFTYLATLPGGKPQVLLKVNWSFEWQMSYRLADPLFLPAGTRLEAIAEWDNSRNNPHNPDPEAAVSWGEQTWQEMMVGFFDIAVDPSLDKKAFFGQRKGQ